MYIDKYRTFKKSEILFSNKFDVLYNHNQRVLSIEESHGHINIYPSHITNISGILGKNASGKSSLLSLIGKKIEDRHRAHEIYSEEEKNPHKKIDILSLEELSGLKNLQYNSSYFLLYYLGKDIDGFPLFIFETNTPKVYINIFADSNETPIHDLGYYIEKGWLSAVFKNKQNQNIFLGNTQNYPDCENGIQNDISIISFQKDLLLNSFQIANSVDEESKICLKRRAVPLRNIFLESQVKFLSQQMNLPSFQTGMYRNERYSMCIQFKDIMLSNLHDIGENEDFDIEDIIKDYREFNIEALEEWQRITLAFLYRYSWYVITSYFDSTNNSAAQKKEQLKALVDIQAQSNSYLDIKQYFHKKIDLILVAFDNEDLVLPEFIKTETSLEKFLRHAQKHHITYRYKEDDLIIDISKDSNWKAVDFFFKNFVDERMHKNLNKCDSIISGFLEINIQWLSDGERENLALFASLDEQISMNPHKKEYLLLFDEIERSLHPDLCRCLISDLVDFLKQYPGKQFQIIIASHSPFIASDLLKENIVCLSRNGQQSIVINMSEKPFAQNIHTILKSQFFLDGFIGKYATRCIEVILECLECKKPEDLILILNKFLITGDSIAPVEQISSIGAAQQFMEFVTQSIGEPLIRNELSRRLSNKAWCSTEEKILYYRNKIAELEETLYD